MVAIAIWTVLVLIEENSPDSDGKLFEIATIVLIVAVVIQIVVSIGNFLRQKQKLNFRKIVLTAVLVISLIVLWSAVLFWGTGFNLYTFFNGGYVMSEI